MSEMNKTRYLYEYRYFKAIGKKCIECNEGYYLEHTQEKSDWKGYRICSRCGHKVVCIHAKEDN